MNVTQAMARLYSVALFAPGFEGATATNILLRAERILAGETVSELADRRALAAELAGLRDNLAQRQDLLQRVHDTLAAKNIGKPRTVELTHRQAQGSRIARERRDAENRGDPSEDPGR